MDRITRKELKSDKFALEVEQTVTFFEEHQKDLVRYGGIAVVVALLIVGYTLYSRHQHTQREAALYKAMQIVDAPVGPPTPGVNMNFPTQDLKDQAALKVLADVQSQYSGSTEAEIAQYYVGAIRADEGKLADAEKAFKEVSEKGDARYASLAKLSLAQIYFADGRDSQGEALLKDLENNPTEFVSKDQAQITRARYLIKKNPAEARKILDALRAKPGAASQAALSLYAELPPA